MAGGGVTDLRLVLAIACSATVVLAAYVDAGRDVPLDLAALRVQYQRPASLPVPADNPLSREKIALGARLFLEKRLSDDDSKSCASCHDPVLSFTDGVPIGRGVHDRSPSRHTPHLWNLAWAKTLFWDGRAASLEEQARGPVENPNEMGQPLSTGLRKIGGDDTYKAAFASAFPDDPRLSQENALAALASYERTLISPPTRFDNWIAGDAAALSDSEVKGFLIFNGKAGCNSCHSGWAFTDHAFHDIGLPGQDPGRGPIIGLAAVNHAFKTPSLRELNWTAPYMHDGSLATIEDVLAHYDRGGERRATLSPDMPNATGLTDEERQNLIAFLDTLSSERPPRPSAQLLAYGPPPRGEPTSPIATSTVTQKNKQFGPGAIALRRGDVLTVVNDDTRPHNVRIFDRRLKFDSGLQEPGDKARIELREAGTFEAFCGIHPNMRLMIEVK